MRNSRRIGLHFANLHPEAKDLITALRPGSATLFEQAIQLVPHILSVVPDCVILLRPEWTEGVGGNSHGFDTTEAKRLGVIGAEIALIKVDKIINDYPTGDYLLQDTNEGNTGNKDIEAAYYLAYINRIEELRPKHIKIRGTIFDAQVGSLGADWVEHPGIQQLFSRAVELDCPINYHGYGPGGDGSRHKLQLMLADEAEWFSLLMVQLWNKAQSSGVPMPWVIHGEAGTYDPWHGKFSDDVMKRDTIDFAEYLAVHAPYIRHFNLFDYGTAPRWEGFNYLGHSVINDAIAAWNGSHDKPLEGDVPVDEVFEAWLAAYKDNHDGYSPEFFEYRMHQIALGQLVATKGDLFAALGNIAAAEKQANLIADRLLPL